MKDEQVDDPYCPLNWAAGLRSKVEVLAAALGNMDSLLPPAV